MATNKKSVQRKADAKRAGRRARAWTALVYKESAEPDWQRKLEEMLVECLISPYHDKDVNPTGETKKPHWHVVISFKNPCTYGKAKEVFDGIGAVVPPETQCRVKDFRQMARYLCHMDQPDKYQYNPSAVRSIGAIDYQALVMSASDEDEMLDAIFDFIRTYNVVSFAEFIDLIRAKKPEWRRVAYHQYSGLICRYIKSCEWELRQEM